LYLFSNAKLIIKGILQFEGFTQTRKGKNNINNKKDQVIEQIYGKAQKIR